MKEKIKKPLEEQMNTVATCAEEKISIERFKKIEELKSRIRQSITDHQNYRGKICQISQEGSFISLHYK
jgi:hypothetical protein